MRTCHPDARIFTYWDYFRNAYARDAGIRIDHLLLNRALAPRLLDAGVDRGAVRGWRKPAITRPPGSRSNPPEPPVLFGNFGLSIPSSGVYPPARATLIVIASTGREAVAYRSALRPTPSSLDRKPIMSKLAGKVAVVTGASKGIGAAVAKALAAEGAAVVVNYASSQAGAQAVVQEITAAKGKAVAVGGDVSKAADAQAIVAAALSQFGRLDILVNNAGVYEFAALADITEEHYHKQFDVNVLGLLLMTQAAAPIWAKAPA